MYVMLQWGRDLKIAEIRLEPGGELVADTLQWGRDLKIAEMSIWLRLTRPQPGFNGAAI